MTTISAIELTELQPTRPAAARVANVQNPRELGSGPMLSRENADSSPPSASNLRIFFTVFQLCMINFLSNFTTSIITIGLPTIARSISLPRALYLWPASVYGLASGATLLLTGSIADLTGAWRVEVVGCLLLSVFTVACGLADTGIQLVIFRTFQGIANSMHLPASVALVAAAVPQGKSRNLAFGCLGLSQPLGFSAGLVISGIMIERAGWRSGFYVTGGATFVAAVTSIWTLPKLSPQVSAAGGDVSVPILRRLWTEIDWIGCIIASTGLALLAYTLAVLSADLSTIHKPSTAVLLALGLVLLLTFPLWMRRCELAGKPALIPNSLWKKLSFTSTCIMVALSYGVMNSMELFSSLYFQEIQNTSTFFTSLRLLPNLLVGTIINLTVGLFVDKVSARWLVAVSSILCAGAPLLMALVDPEWNYWYMEFWAQVLAPMSGDVLFTVGLLIVSDEFPEKTQALAGAVFNTVAQFGMSLGVGVSQVVALSVGGGEAGEESSSNDDNGPSLKGYQASFWTMFALMVMCSIVAIGGLRKAGKVGVKRD